LSAVLSVSELSAHKLQKSQAKKQDFQASRQQAAAAAAAAAIIIIIIITIVIADALHSPKNISSRIVFFFMLILTVFIITSYSATIVSLLQTSSNTINSLQDLMKSPLRLSMVDSFVNVSSC
jgi:ABC-type siderophore export system fused ATPase/permease subunit